ncbi:MAG TPA: carboxypeptidase-like regulatory domain-containing protein [Saprospiraceae bacterium]|nr:carboxypeptidase-like regulatory domain-containing protein [Saprospiraceae bacterium]
MSCKSFLIIVFLISSIYSNYAQEGKYLVRGTVTDVNTGKPIELATLFIPQTNYFAESDINGSFEIKLNSSRKQILKIHRLGYETGEEWIIFPKDQSIINLQIHLKQVVSTEVLIRSDKNTDGPVVRENAASFQLLPTVSGNIESVLPSIGLGIRPGAGGELSSQYSVRGGSYDENLVYINDFEVYRPQIIKNSQQEGLSIANPDLINDLYFSSGGFDAKYGDKMASVLDIKYKVPEEFKASVQASLLGGSLSMEGSTHISKIKDRKLRFLLGARYKSNQYLLSSLDVKGEYQPRFFDLQTYLNYNLGPNAQLNCLINWNYSQFHLIPESSTVGKGNFLQVLRLNTVYFGSEDDLFDQKMAGLSFTYFPQKRKIPHFVKMLASTYLGNEAERFDIQGYYRLAEIEIGNTSLTEAKEVSLWGEGIQHNYSRNYLESIVYLGEIRGGIDFKNIETLFKSHFVQYGLQYKNELFQDKVNEWQRIDSAGYSLPLGSGKLLVNEVIKAENEIHSGKWNVWMQDQFNQNIGSSYQLKWTLGLRGLYSMLNHQFMLCPRGKIELLPIQNSAQRVLYLAGGIYAQPPLFRELRDPGAHVDLNQKFQRSVHYVLGYKSDFLWKPISDKPFRWITEFYYKTYTDLVSYDLDNVRIRYSGHNDAKAYAIGWDNRINGEFVPGAESWVNISFLRTRERLNGVQHKTHVDAQSDGKDVADVPRPTDQLFALSMFFQDYLPMNQDFKMHLQGTVASGLPYGFRGNNIVYRNEFRHKAYHRVDIGFSYKLWGEAKSGVRRYNWTKYCRSAWVSLEVFNLLKVKNEASVRWIKSIYDYQFAIPNYLSSRRINLKLRFDF